MTFANTVIMLEEADPPFEGFSGIAVFQGVSTALCEFDDLTVSLTGSRPSLGEMVGVELKQAGTMGRMADDDVFAAFLTDFEFIHGSPEVLDTFRRHEITHPFGINRGGRRELNESSNRARQTVNNRSF